MVTRHEKVVLSLQGSFTPGMVKASMATQVLATQLDRLSKQSVQTSRASQSMGRDFDRAGTSIDQFSGRMALAARILGATGSGMVPILTAAVPAVVGLSTQLGFAAAAGGTAMLAFQGVGGALEAMNKAHLEPTAENLEAARVAMKNISPAAQDLVHKLREMGSEFKAIRTAASEGLMPGLTEGLDNIESLLPKIADIVGVIGDATGDMLADGAASLASDRWSGFFDFLESEARPTITTLGQTVGNLAHGMAELWIQLNPLSDDFTGGLLQASERFDKWAQGISKTEGFAEFIAYVRETGPQVAETVGALGNALLQIGEAAAPLGGPVLEGIEAFADAIAVIADSPLGTPIMAGVAAMSALSLATAAFARVAATSWGTAIAGATGYSVAAGAAGAGAGAKAAKGAGVGVLGRAGIAGAVASIVAPYLSSLPDVVAGADSALATGKLTELEQQLESLKKKRDDLNNVTGTKDFFGDLADTVVGSSGLAPGLQDIEDKIKSVDAAIAEAGGGSQAFSRELGFLGSSATGAAGAFSTLNGRLNALDQALTGRASWRDYEASLDAATESAKVNGKTLDRNTAAGRANEATLDAIAATAIRVAENLKGADKVRFMKRARQDFIGAAVDMGMTEGQAKKLANSLDLVGSEKPRVKVQADTDKATSDVKMFDNLLQGLDGNTARTYVQNTIETRRVYTNIGLNKPKVPFPSADGGTIPGFADGGTPWTVPGPRKPYRDQILAYLAPGEEVITNRNGEADRFRADRAAGLIPAYANGGTAGRRRGESESAHELRKALGRLSDSLDKDREARNDLRTTVRDNLRSDIFGESDAWLGGGDPLAKLRADIAGARALNKDRKALSRKGLDRGALDALLSEASPAQVDQFAHMSRKRLAEYERLYNTRQRVTASVGRSAGNAAYGQDVRATTKEIKRLGTKLDRVEKAINRSAKSTGNEMGRQLNGAASTGRSNQRKDRR